MLRIATILIISTLAFSVIACSSDDDGNASPTEPVATPATTPADGATSEPTDVEGGTLALTSSAFEDDGAMPAQYTCEGEGISPPLTLAGVPAETASLVLIMRDANLNGFVHWTAWNILPATTDVPAGAVPQGAVQGETDRRTEGYFGPCPGAGPGGEPAAHNYVFTLYAIDSELTLAPGASEEALLDAMHGHILDQASLTGSYVLSSGRTPQ